METFFIEHWRTLIVVGGIAFLLWLAWWAGRPKLKKKDEPQAKKVVEPPQADLLFLANFGYGFEEASEIWNLIRSEKGMNDYFTARLYAKKKYTRWYLKLSQVEKKKFEWDNLWNELKAYVENDPDYWQIQPSLLEFVFRVRAYTG